MNDAIDAIVDKAKAVATNSSPEDLVYLGKTLEAVGPASELNFIVQAGETQVSAVESASSTAQNDINTAKTDAVAAISTGTNANATPFGKVAHLMNTRFNNGCGGSYRSSFVVGTDGVAYGWGCDNGHHQANGHSIGNHPGAHPIGFMPDGGSPPGKFIEVQSNAYLGAGLTEDGKVWMWGYNGHGQQGVGHTSNEPWGRKANIGATITQIAIGKGFSNNSSSVILALDSTGDVWSWGYNGHGQCGRNGTSTNTVIYTPQKIGALDGVTITKIFAANGDGAGHCAAIDSSGGLWMWGYNGYGNCGVGHTSTVSSPVKINGNGALPSSAVVRHVSLKGHNHNFTHIVTTDGKLYSMGYNGHGQLNNGNTSQQNTPVLSIWFNGSNSDRKIKLSSGTNGFYGEDTGAYIWTGQNNSQSFTHALSQSDKLYGWGNNEYSCLGAGGTSHTHGGNPYHSFSGAVRYIACGGYDGHNYAVMLMEDGTVKVTGYNGNYALGHSNGHSYGWDYPHFPPGVQGNIKEIVVTGTTSEQGTIFLLNDGRIYMCGYGGEMAQGTERDSTMGSVHFVEWN